MTEIGVVDLLNAEGSDIPDDPRVSAAAATADDKVRVMYDQAVRATTPGNADDALNPANYLFTTGAGVARVPVSVSLVQGMPTIVEITLDGEMTDSVTYNVAVSNVVSIYNAPLNTQHDDADFTGQGTYPEIDTAIASGSTVVEITFSEEMLNNAALTVPSNYIFAGATTLTPTSVVRLSGTQVRVAVNEMLNSGAYTVRAQNIYDLSQNLITAVAEPFTGVGVGPYIAFAVPTAADAVRVTFSETVDPTDAADPANYQVYRKGAPAIQLPVVSATQHTPQTYNLVLSVDQTSGIEYTLRTDDIRDLVGNIQDPNPDTEDFVGIGVSPPEIIISPDEAAANVSIRRYVRVTCADATAGFTGVNLSSVWIRVDYTDENGVAHSSYAVQGGAVQPAYEGYTRGDAATTAGITFFFRPKGKVWVSQQRYNIIAFAADNEASSNLVTSFFDTAVPDCFEDEASPQSTRLEQLLLSRLGLYNVDRLREALLRECTVSPVRHVQARTLLWLVTLTDLEGTLAGLVDFSIVGEDVKLCDRNRVSNIYAKLVRLMPAAVRAIEEIPNIRPEAKLMLRDRLDNNSMVYVVNAMATIVVSAIVFGEF
ncbi:MAG: hypothetical protein DRP01_02005 [Archaeoglobales archaeon]|nr:MAG: hypothetical protein DRP01_02005 [Archaeoglobales archaeon]